MSGIIDIDSENPRHFVKKWSYIIESFVYMDKVTKEIYKAKDFMLIKLTYGSDIIVENESELPPS